MATTWHEHDPVLVRVCVHVHVHVHVYVHVYVHVHVLFLVHVMSCHVMLVSCHVMRTLQSISYRLGNSGI